MTHPQSAFYGGGGIAIHLLALDLPATRLDELERHLSSDERARAGRFLSHALRRRFVAARGQLREILGRELHLAPGCVPIAQGPWGKLYLPGAGAVRFNLSHSADRGACALSREWEVGIDIEQYQLRRDELGLGRAVFTAAEMERLSRLDRGTRAESLCRLWSCKEAICKGDGRGLSLDPRSFDVPAWMWLERTAESALPPRATVLVAGRSWRLERRDGPEGFTVALAVEAEATRGRSTPDHTTRPRSGKVSE